MMPSKHIVVTLACSLTMLLMLREQMPSKDPYRTIPFPSVQTPSSLENSKGHWYHSSSCLGPQIQKSPGTRSSATRVVVVLLTFSLRLNSSVDALLSVDVDLASPECLPLLENFLTPGLHLGERDSSCDVRELA